MLVLVRKAKTLLLNPKRLIDRGVAPLVYRFLGEKRLHRILGTWFKPAARTPLEALLFDGVFSCWINNVYIKETDPDVRERLKDVCMGGENGAAWAASYDDREVIDDSHYGDIGFYEANPQLDATEDTLRRAPEDTVFVQIGCSSGRETDYFAKKFPALTFIGTDIDETIVGRAAANHVGDNLSYRVARAHTVFDVVDGSGPVVLFSSGSLQYAQPEHLKEMFGKIKQRGKTTLILLEPWSKLGESMATGHSRWRGNFSFSHDYESYANELDLRVAECKTIQTHKDPSSQHFHNHHYFMVCVAD